MELREIGEFGLIARRRCRLPAYPPYVFKRIADDDAITSLSTGTDLVSTVDLLEEKGRFGFTLTSARPLGRKSFTVNLSDIAIIDGGTAISVFIEAMAYYFPLSAPS